jgi:pyrrolidone-carboxylate peptidase
VDLLVTGFGDFGDVKGNPSSDLALRLASSPPAGWSARARILDVTYRDARAAAAELTADPPPVLLGLGVRGGDDRMRLELAARRVVSDVADNEGVVATAAWLPEGPNELPGTLFRPGLAAEIGDARLFESDDAGGYLCNFWYYTALGLLSGSRCGFVHVAHSEVSQPDGPHMTLAEQEELLRTLLSVLRKEL